MITAVEALRLLREGNDRFVSGTAGVDKPVSQAERLKLVGGQEPFAVILGCSDSRVPVELIFDRGLGDLFVIRVAGNIVGPSQLGSVEFAAHKIGTRLVVVLGHTGCGAVRATLDELRGSVQVQTPNLNSITTRVRASLDELLTTDRVNDWDSLSRQAVRENVRASASQLRDESETLRRLIQEEGLLVVSAEYSLETGVVDFFDGVSGFD